ncbi:sigma-54 interaction domain-containing protein [Leptospirillum ferriphilum]|jgi:PAS domain S-box-containing protein|uniref:Sigma54-specific transcriptional regulator, Fis family n=3 Tax=Leptospirillum TaxID=179 RepID=J9ZE40_LEPFM|nr:sigma 54-interacting transcriptional regulator [Leptospirillum ferriphilum]AFS54148.1 sigma54-specific transcriptional regulator, Fis family [Leptospirillum ferriphilum ML-04]EDZ38023.1 MAG: sigma54-specific transcriptional regulator, Fis family [Leptospirillum sp. Group II '5-way CG']KGA93393.1 putative two component, sigma54 specific, transcriptional regulator, Fis family [Leptospirillum ferriphilum]
MKSQPVSIRPFPGNLAENGTSSRGLNTFPPGGSPSDAQAILDSLEEGVVAIGLDKKILYMNRAAREILKNREDSPTPSDCRKVVNSSECQARCVLAKTVETGEPIRNMEISLVDALGRRRVLRLNTALLKDSSGKVFGGVEIFHDISQIVALKEELKGRYSFGRIIGRSEKMQEIFDLLPVIAQSKSTVLIEGESGTGKELVAHALHENSPRREGPFVKLNCAALSEGVLESELFGHVKGAFTGAVQSRPGRFELASGGTLFLDEIGEISPSMQVKLLRVLQEEEFERVGGTKTVKVDVRVIAATNRDLKQAMEEGSFRKDLYYRLRVIPVTLPPLRERQGDLPLLIQSFIERYNAELGKNIQGLTSEAMKVLFNYHYPGNIRELQNIIEHAALLCNDSRIDLRHLPGDLLPVQSQSSFLELAMMEENPVRYVEKELIRMAMAESGGNISEVARKLSMGRSTLWRRLKEMKLA